MNLAITCLFTSIDNPMCPGCDNYKPDVAIIAEWLKSLQNCSAYVLHDELTADHWYEASRIATVPLSFFQVGPTAENLFMQRWRHLHERLARAIHIEQVWITDGSDVRMLNPPWAHMKPDVLYVGSENDTVSNKWILNNHPSLRGFAGSHRNNRLLNAGLLGGDRPTVLSFIERLIERFETSAGDLTDMAAFNLALYEGDAMFETGYPIHTKFGAWAVSDPHAYFAHK